jgi:cell division septation protein DedD
MSETSERKELKLDHRHLALFFLGAVVICAVFFILGFLVGKGQTYEISKKVPLTPNSGTSVAQNSPLSSNTVPAGDSKGLGLSQEPPLPLPPPSTESRTVAGAASKKGGPTAGGGSASESTSKKDLDFYEGVKQSHPQEKIHPAVKPVEKPATSSKTDVAKSTAPPKPELAKPKPDAAGKKSVSLQVAALKRLEDADQLMKNLRAKGYEVFLVRPSSNSADQWIRVQVGPFANETEAAKVKGRLQKDGYQPITKR